MMKKTLGVGEFAPAIAGSGGSKNVRRMMRGLSITSAILAGTVLGSATASAQVLDIVAENGGTLSVTSPASYAGFTEITNGQLIFDVDLASSPLLFDLALTDIIGVLSVSKLGLNTVILSGDGNNYTGGTALDFGSIEVRSNPSLGGGALVMADGTSLVAGIDGLVLANAITTLGGGLIASNGNVFTL
ncbi:hypothetical protein, partial [Polymorphobacter multimanifer]|uniref:hypothetical protein n=1 Tax=Polymorphobacter multimanifer TaxID=1070431 RepID=UPI001A9C69F0